VSCVGGGGGGGTFEALKVFHLRSLSHFRFSKSLFCDPCETSGSQTLSCRSSGSPSLSFATPVTLQALKPSHLRPLTQLWLSTSFIFDPCHT
jgi:hypothetical protein